MTKSKITRSHTTSIKAVDKIVPLLLANSEIKKVSLGIISPCKVLRGSQRVRIWQENGCILLKVRGISATQEIRVYCSNCDLVIRFILGIIETLGFQIGE